MAARFRVVSRRVKVCPVESRRTAQACVNLNTQSASAEGEMSGNTREVTEAKIGRHPDTPALEEYHRDASHAGVVTGCQSQSVSRAGFEEDVRIRFARYVTARWRFEFIGASIWRLANHCRRADVNGEQPRVPRSCRPGDPVDGCAARPVAVAELFTGPVERPSSGLAAHDHPVRRQRRCLTTERFTRRRRRRHRADRGSNNRSSADRRPASVSGAAKCIGERGLQLREKTPGRSGGTGRRR